MTHAPNHPVIWAEIQVSDLARASAFYKAATGLGIHVMQMGGEDVAVLEAADRSGVSCSLHVGTPSKDGSGARLHLVADGTLEETIARVETAGGAVNSPPIEIPEGRFFYGADPDGNPVSFFEAA